MTLRRNNLIGGSRESDALPLFGGCRLQNSDSHGPLHLGIRGIHVSDPRNMGVLFQLKHGGLWSEFQRLEPNPREGIAVSKPGSKVPLLIEEERCGLNALFNTLDSCLKFILYIPMCLHVDHCSQFTSSFGNTAKSICDIKTRGVLFQLICGGIVSEVERWRVSSRKDMAVSKIDSKPSVLIEGSIHQCGVLRFLHSPEEESIAVTAKILNGIYYNLFNKMMKGGYMT